MQHAGSSIFLLTMVLCQESEAAPNRIMLSQDASCEEEGIDPLLCRKEFRAGCGSAHLYSSRGKSGVSLNETLSGTGRKEERKGGREGRKKS